jgi:hypothetical protein
MPRKDSEGNLTFAASEVAMFAVCPEMWRLIHLKKAKANNQAPNQAEGQNLHQQWTSSFYEAIFLTEGTRFILMIILLGLLFLILPFTL